jgi:lipoprotein-releasing system permease protein
VSVIFFLANKLLRVRRFSPETGDSGSETFISFISWVSILGVFLGTVALSVVTSVFNGFERELRGVITQLYGEVVVISPYAPLTEEVIYEMSTLPDVANLIERVDRSLNFELMVASQHRVVGGLLDATENQHLANLLDGVFPQKMHEVALGFALAQKLNVRKGDEVRLVLPFRSFEKAQVSTVRVVGIVQLGLYEYDSKMVFMDLVSAQTQLHREGIITRLSVRLHHPAQSHRVVGALSHHFGDRFRIKEYTQFNTNLFFAIELQKVMVSIILGIIVLVAAFNIISTLMMLIHEKSLQISILRAMGLSSWQCFCVFLGIGTWIGFAGVVSGLGLGVLLCVLLQHVSLIELPRQIYNLSKLPVVINLAELGVIGLSCFLICVLSAIFPAWRISRQPLLRGFRS